MKLQQEELDSLNQLDRIEYCLIRNEIKERTAGVSSDIAWYLIFVGLFSLIIAFLFKLTHGDYYFYYFFNFSGLLFVFAIVYLGFAFLINFKRFNDRRKLLEWLDKRYFEVRKKK